MTFEKVFTMLSPVRWMVRIRVSAPFVLQTRIWSDQVRIEDSKSSVNWSDQMLTSIFFGPIIGAELARAAGAAMRVFHRRQHMKTIKGPAIFLAQFAGDAAPFNTLDSIAKWASGLGYKGIQMPSWDGRLFNLKNAAESKTYCEEVKGTLAQHGLSITELSTHLQGQLVAVHPAYDAGFDGFAAPEVRGNPAARQKWAVQQLLYAAKASANLGLTAHASFSGALAWPYLYSWPPRPPGLIEEAFDELARRWRPILDAFDGAGVDVCYEIHPGEDLHDGETYEMFLERVGNHKRACLLYDPSHFVLQQLNYLDYIDYYHDRIKIFHVKDAEFNPTGKQGVYGGFQPWLKRAGRFRSLGDGQVDFAAIFSKMAAYDFPGWAVLEWECCLKHPEDGAREGATFIADHIIRVAERSFDDFAGGGVNTAENKKMLGIG
jgi:sugar phosphate isomerase/epimerase